MAALGVGTVCLKLLPQLNRHILEDRTLKGGEDSPWEVHPVHAVAAFWLRSGVGLAETARRAGE
ncbi:hypothetical protein AB0C90_15070 [Streptomyces sp. NPDC048550]|uniref:hypothetical protein n=1 Tax=Streptomyces sp. NPDC048550 TaxID=3155739 RepID=UPI0034322AE1